VDDSGKRSDNRASKPGEGAFLGRSAGNFQENVTQSASVAGASYALIGAIILLGGIGYALDRWLGTSPWCLLGGLLLGIIVGFYELARTVWPSKR
jgi:F0F1-type ATP synthase assembly protein I